MNYQIIKDEEALREFIEWLPELKHNEIYYFSLFARKKYFPALSSDKAQLKRFTSRKDLMYAKIKQLECELGSYTQGNLSIPNEALALYISINPRNMELATKKALKIFVDLVTAPYNGYNPQSEVLNELQVAAGTRHYFDLDFDKVDLAETLKEVDKVIPNKYFVLKTKNGFHVLIDSANLTPQETKSWFKSLTKLPGYDARGGDNLVPVPGCVQGDHVPTLFKNLCET